ncbi:MAG: DUF2292 domain-containing protein [Planctomycetes bacterium]|nr:DUF2292 domain-containing protein [Planctomycetota bacterium]
MSQTHRTPDRPEPPAAPTSAAALRRIGDALSGLRFGSVLAIVQDGVVVQIERTEKTRLDKADR